MCAWWKEEVVIWKQKSKKHWNAKTVIEIEEYADTKHELQVKGGFSGLAARRCMVAVSCQKLKGNDRRYTGFDSAFTHHRV